MKNCVWAATLFALCLIVPMTAVAEDIEPGWYIGAGYAFVNYDEDGVPDLDLGAVIFRSGFQFNEYLSAEARFGLGVDDDSVWGVDVELENLYGGYFRAGLPTGVGFYPYVIVGATHGQIKANVPGYGSDRYDETDVSYGGGIDFYLDPSLSLTAEYMMLIDKNDAKWSGVTLTLNLKF